MIDLSGVKAGDTVERDMCGLKIPMEVEVVADGIIYCAGGWMFMVNNGAEYDPDLGWDGITATGSMLTRVL